MALWRKPKLIDAPVDPRIAPVDRLETFTAESLVVVLTTPKGVAELLAAARDREPVTLRHAANPDARDVTFVPVKAGTLRPTLDPNRGWLLPFTPAAGQELLATVRADAGGQWELTEINIGIIAEPPATAP